MSLHDSRESAGERAINGFENQDPAGYLRLFRPGGAVIGYQSKAYPLELPAEKFNEFLQQEGFDSVRVLRHQRGEDARPDREQFSRYAKAIVGSGELGSRAAEPFGYRFEIVAETSNRARISLIGRRSSRYRRRSKASST